MTNDTSSPRETVLGPQQIERMLRVSPLTISAVYKMADRVGQGYVLNLSRGGVFLSSDVGFEMGDQFRLRFFLPFQLGQVDAKSPSSVAYARRRQPSPRASQRIRTRVHRDRVEMQDKISRFIEKFVDLAEQLES